MTDDEIALWLITKGTMEDKPVMRLAADRIIQMAQAVREHDDLVECNEQFFVDNEFLKKRVEKGETERDEAYARGYSDAETEISKSALGQKNDFLLSQYVNAAACIKDLNELLNEAQAEWRKYEWAWMTAEGKLEEAVQGLEKCQAELDEYSRQEYPLDHTVHERYRQRDYDANPARITLAALKGETL